jgi:hypothetical protein
MTKEAGRRDAWGAILAVWVIGLLSGPAVKAASGVEIFATGFEPPEYEVGFTLADQEEWLGDAAGGNQVFEGYFPDLGQHGLVGFSQPEGGVSSVSVWRPLNVNPVAAGNPVVTFSVVMAIADSENGSLRDSFRWSVYNTNAQPTRLFSLDFDNATTNVAYLLDEAGGEFVPTPFFFERDGLYELTIVMDFEKNHWSARLNDETVVDHQPITTVGAGLHLGDIDAVWVRGAGNANFGDNFMVFDDYSVVMAQAASPWIRLVERREDGAIVVEVEGEEGQNVAVDFSDDLVGWNEATAGVLPASRLLTFVDQTASGEPRRFYRGRLIP